MKDKLEMTMFIIAFPYYFYQTHLKKQTKTEEKETDDDD